MTDKLSIAVPDIARSASFQKFSPPPPNEGEYVDIVSEEINWEGHCSSGVSFEAAVISGARLARTKLRSIKLCDVSFKNGDLANADWTGAAFNRVEVLAARLTGFNGTEGNYRDVAFKECIAKYAVFHSATFNRCLFEQCDLSDVTFEGATLRNVAFVDCELSNARFVAAKLTEVDLRGSRLTGIQMDVQDLRGVTIETLQAVAIASLTGVRIQG